MSTRYTIQRVTTCWRTAHLRGNVHSQSTLKNGFRQLYSANTYSEANSPPKDKPYIPPPSEQLLKRVEESSKTSLRRLTLKELLSLGPIPSEKQLLDGANYLQKELPRRLAARIMDIQNLPYIVGCNEHIYKIYLLYLNAFDDFSQQDPVTNATDEARYMKRIREHLSRHSDVLPTLALAAPEIAPYMTAEELKVFLDKMIRTRISRRVIVEQQMAMNRIFHTGLTAEDEFNNGIFSTRVNPAQATKKLYRNLKRMCVRIYGDAPRLIVNGHMDATFTYIPSHLEFIIQELLKNSIRATMEAHAARIKADPDNTQPEGPPPIIVTCSHGEEDFIIRISDKGGGITPLDLPHVFDYSFSTAVQSHVPHMSAWEDGHLQTNQAGPAFGLPMARLYTEYFRGSLWLYSCHGYGTDVFIRLGLSLDNRETKQLI